MKTKQFLGKTITIDRNTIWVTEPNKKSIITFNNAEQARREFNRLTNSHKGPTVGTKRVHKTPTAVVHYNQLIIQL